MKDYKCPQCSDDLVYQPAAAQFYCTRCKTYKTLAQLTGVSLIDQLRAQKKQNTNG